MIRRLAALLLLSSLLAPAARAFEGESILEVQTRWRRHLEELRSLSREERLAQSKAFFATVSWGQLQAYCGNEAAGPDESHIVGTLVNAKLRSGGAEPEIIAAMIADPGCNSACQESLVKFISQYRDSVRQLPDAALYGQAMLDLADSGVRNEPISWKLEEGAAYLSSSPRFLQRMMRYGRAQDDREAEHGVVLLVQSHDENAPDSLLLLAREMMDGGRSPRALARATQGLAEHCNEEIWSFLETYYRKLKAEEPESMPYAALLAMAYTQDPRCYPILLAEYKDGTFGIHDATGEIQDPDLRRFYYDLWHFTRQAEPGIIAQLDADGEAAESAVELLDRASRFGLPASREDLVAPLEAWGERQDEPWRSRAAEIVARFRSYPEPTEVPRRH